MGQETSKSGAPPSQAQQQPHTHLPVIDSRGLFGNCNEVRLRHRGKEYRLRITRQGKLILTK